MHKTFAERIDEAVAKCESGYHPNGVRLEFLRLFARSLKRAVAVILRLKSSLDAQSHELASDNAQLAEDAQTYRENYERIKAELKDQNRACLYMKDMCDTLMEDYAKLKVENERLKQAIEADASVAEATVSALDNEMKKFNALHKELAAVKRRWAESSAWNDAFAERGDEFAWDKLPASERESKINHWLAAHEEEMKNA